MNSQKIYLAVSALIFLTLFKQLHEYVFNLISGFSYSVQEQLQHCFL